MAINPACGVEVDPTNPDASTTHRGTKYVFCSEGAQRTLRGESQPVCRYRDGVSVARANRRRSNTAALYGWRKWQFELSVVETVWPTYRQWSAGLRADHRGARCTSRHDRLPVSESRIQTAD